MNEHFQGMKKALGGQGGTSHLQLHRPLSSMRANDNAGGLQGTSSAVGEMIASNSDMRSGSSKKHDEATASLGEFANPNSTNASRYSMVVTNDLAEGASTVPSSVSGSDQVKNQNTGTADHLDLAFRKDT